MSDIDHNINAYRAPMVTAIGIILGFVLGFMGKLATDLPINEDKVAKLNIQDFWVFLGLLFGMILLTVAMYRILNNRVPMQKMENYYFRTLQIFISGVFISFIGTLVVFVQGLMF